MIINILGYSYTIIFTDNIAKVVGEKSGTFDGFFDNDIQTIYIDKLILPELQQSALIHEILEVIISKLNIKISHDDIERLEVGLFQVLLNNQNKDLTKFLNVV